jgi:hypothetical protein
MKKTILLILTLILLVSCSSPKQTITCPEGYIYWEADKMCHIVSNNQQVTQVEEPAPIQEEIKVQEMVGEPVEKNTKDDYGEEQEEKVDDKCGSNYYNCDDFDTFDEAQELFEACGGVSNDVHRLDRDKDGLACEALP